MMDASDVQQHPVSEEGWLDSEVRSQLEGCGDCAVGGVARITAPSRPAGLFQWLMFVSRLVLLIRLQLPSTYFSL